MTKSERRGKLALFLLTAVTATLGFVGMNQKAKAGCSDDPSTPNIGYCTMDANHELICGLSGYTCDAS